MSIVIEEAVDSGHEPVFCYAEGHHDPNAFLQALYEYCDAYEDAELTEDMVEHVWFILSSNPDIQIDDRDYLLVKSNESALGAFSATKVDVQ